MKANDPSKRVQRRYKENSARRRKRPNEPSYREYNRASRMFGLCAKKPRGAGGVGARREREHGRGSKAEKRRLEGVAGYDV